MRTTWLAVSMLAAVACGGSDGDTDAERICAKSAACVGGTQEDIEACEADVAMGPSGVQAECADCLDANACSEIADACEEACGPLLGPDRRAIATNVCATLVTCGFDVVQTCVNDLDQGPLTTEALSTCRSCVVAQPCAAIEDGACNTACPGIL